MVGHGFSDQEVESAVAGVQSTLFQELDGDLREAAVLAITKSMQSTFILVPVAGGVVLLAALCMKRDRLFGTPTAVDV